MALVRRVVDWGDDEYLGPVPPEGYTRDSEKLICIEQAEYNQLARLYVAVHKFSQSDFSLDARCELWEAKNRIDYFYTGEGKQPGGYQSGKKGKSRQQ